MDHFEIISSSWLITFFDQIDRLKKYFWILLEIQSRDWTKFSAWRVLKGPKFEENWQIEREGVVFEKNVFCS